MKRGLPWLCLALAACALGCSGGSSEGPACVREEEPPASVKVFHRPFSARVRTDLSLKEIRGLTPGPDSGSLQGLTVVEHAFERRWKRSVRPSLRRGSRCVLLSDLTVDLTPSKVEIFIPREYPEGSCELEEVLRHEREHEQVHRKALEGFAERLRSAVYRADWLPVNGVPLVAADEDEADKRLDDAFQKVLKPVHAWFLQELSDHNSTLDAPGNYRWVTARCSGWR